MYAVGYLPDGMDATVYYGSLDFRFQNNTKYPIRVEAYMKDKRLTIRILGTELEETYVKMENKQVSFTQYETIYKADETILPGEETVDVTGYSARKVEVYRNVYNGDGSLISRTLESVNNYKRRDKIVLVNPDDPRLVEATLQTVPAELPQENAAVPLD
jgi:vancomycin resistance protein YoaR